MSSSTRSRSVSRSRIIKSSDVFTSGRALDPYILLEEVLKNLNSTDIPLAVTIGDGTSSVSFLLSVFLSKDYEVVDDEVILGFRRLKIDSIKAKIEFNVEVE